MGRVHSVVKVRLKGAPALGGTKMICITPPPAPPSTRLTMPPVAALELCSGCCGFATWRAALVASEKRLKEARNSRGCMRVFDNTTSIRRTWRALVNHPANSPCGEKERGRELHFVFCNANEAIHASKVDCVQRFGCAAFQVSQYAGACFGIV